MTQKRFAKRRQVTDTICQQHVKPNAATNLTALMGKGDQALQVLVHKLVTDSTDRPFSLYKSHVFAQVLGSTASLTNYLNH